MCLIKLNCGLREKGGSMALKFLKLMEILQKSPLIAMKSFILRIHSIVEQEDGFEISGFLKLVLFAGCRTGNLRSMVQHDLSDTRGLCYWIQHLSKKTDVS